MSVMCYSECRTLFSDLFCFDRIFTEHVKVHKDRHLLITANLSMEAKGFNVKVTITSSLSYTQIPSEVI